MIFRNTYLYKPINEFSPLKFQRRDTDLGLAILYIYMRGGFSRGQRIIAKKGVGSE